MSLHSGHNSSNLALSLPDTTTVAITPEDKAPTGATPTTDKPRIKAPNASRNGKFCVYCKIMNHSQEECRKRMRDNKPCVNNIGQLYLPKIDNIETNSAHSNNDSKNGVGLVFQSRTSGLPS
jgi:hypothetical protein